MTPQAADIRALLWASESLLAAEVDEAGVILAASPGLQSWAGRDLAGEPLADLVARPQRDALDAGVTLAGETWTTITVGLLDGGGGAAEDHRVHIAAGPVGGALVVAEPAHAQRDDLVDQVLALNDELIAAQRALMKRQRELERAEARNRAAADRARRLESIVLTGLETQGREGLLERLAGLAVELVGAQAAWVLLRSEVGGPLRLVAGAGSQAGIDEPGRRLAGEVAGARRGALTADLAAVPLAVDDDELGVLVARVAAVHAEEEDLEALRSVGERVSLALGHVWLRDRERRIGETLQRSLLPEQLPDAEGLELCARYLPRAIGVHVGGDFYDAVPLPGGGLLLAIGDVAGKGLRAASAMGEVRSALRAYALLTGDPSRLLEQLDRFVAQSGGMVTALCVAIAPDRTSATLASAGHPGPLLARSPGRPVLVDAAPGPPLGVEFGARRTATLPLKRGDRLLLFTDGLIERRSASLQTRIEELGDAVHAAPENMEAACEDVLAAMADPGREGFDDDVALLAATVRR